MAKAAKKLGIEAPTDSRLDGDREALIEELRRERKDALQRAEDALKSETDLISSVATIIDPFSNNKGEV